MEALRWLRAVGFAALCLLVAFPPPARAADTGTVKGTVVDAAKLVLPGVRVSVVNTSFVALTDNTGAFKLTVAPGRYTVTAELSGFRPETRSDVSVMAGQTTELNFELAIASHLEQVTVTATRTETTLKEVPQNVTVLTSQMLDAMPITSTVGAFDKVVGLDVSGMGAGIARPVFLSIDGYDDTYVRKMIDGVDVNNRSNNFGLMSEFPVELIDRVDVIKGGSSAVWGSGMAGVINIVTKRPQSPRPLVHFGVSASHWGEMAFGDGNAVGRSGSYGKASVDVSQRVGQVGYFLYGSYLNSGGFLEHSIERLGKFAGKVSYDFAPKRYAEVFVSNTLTNSQGGHIFALYPGTPAFFWNYLDDEKIRNTISTVRYVDESRGRLQFNATGKLSSYTFDLTRTNLPSLTADPGIEKDKFGDTITGGSFQATYRWAARRDITAGVDYYHINSDFTTIGFGHLTNDEVGPYVNLTQHVRRLTLNGGLRYDGSRRFQGQVSPQAGAVYNIGRATLVRGSVSRAYQAPILYELVGVSFTSQVLPNPNLRPERAWLYSAGFESNELPWLWLKLSLYDHKMSEGIVTKQRPDGRLIWDNLDTFTRKGVEWEVKGQHPIGLFASLGFNYNKHENTTPDNQQLLTWIPTRIWKSTVGYTNARVGFDLNVTGKYIWYNQQGFVRDILQANDKKWVFDLRVSKNVNLSATRSVSIYADVYNLTDTLFWERIDFPYARRWLDFGAKFTLR